MSETKGILLAGGRGSRLYPMTSVASKQLQPIYDKPMIYYSLTTLLVAGVREVLLVSTPEDLPRFQDLLGDGSQWGVRLLFAEQAEPRGIAEALIIGEQFLADSPCLLMLGDNLIYGSLSFLRDAIRSNRPSGATIFAREVADPSSYGVVELDQQGRPVSLEEKPAEPRSPWAVPGLYIYGHGAAARARKIRPSRRGELEISDLHRAYLADGELRVEIMPRGVAWLDTGTPDSLLAASSFVHTLQSRQGLVIGSPEEAALRMGYVTLEQFQLQLERLPACAYRDYLAHLLPTTFGPRPSTTVARD